MVDWLRGFRIYADPISRRRPSIYFCQQTKCSRNNKILRAHALPPPLECDGERLRVTHSLSMTFPISAAQPRPCTHGASCCFTLHSAPRALGCNAMLAPARGSSSCCAHALSHNLVASVRSLHCHPNHCTTVHKYASTQRAQLPPFPDTHTRSLQPATVPAKILLLAHLRIVTFFRNLPGAPLQFNRPQP